MAGRPAIWTQKKPRLLSRGFVSLVKPLRNGCRMPRLATARSASSGTVDALALSGGESLHVHRRGAGRGATAVGSGKAEFAILTGLLVSHSSSFVCSECFVLVGDLRFNAGILFSELSGKVSNVIFEFGHFPEKIFFFLGVDAYLGDKFNFDTSEERHLICLFLTSFNLAGFYLLSSDLFKKL